MASVLASSRASVFAGGRVSHPASSAAAATPVVAHPRAQLHDKESLAEAARPALLGAIAAVAAGERRKGGALCRSLLLRPMREDVLGLIPTIRISNVFGISLSVFLSVFPLGAGFAGDAHAANEVSTAPTSLRPRLPLLSREAGFAISVHQP